MYRTNDPRFRRRLNEIGQTLENANESAQSSLYIFGQTYVKPCFDSVTSCVTSCVDASCPSLNLSQHKRDRLRRQRGRSQGRAELNFDFYDDWDDDENDALLGWGNDEFDHLAAGGRGTYGSTITHAQPGRQKGMSYPKGRRKSLVLPHDGDPVAKSGSSFVGRLFGGKSLKYKPSAAGLQEHPGSRRLGRDLTEGEALLAEQEHGHGSRSKLRGRSGTAMSAETSDSYSSRGDIFPSDDEHDAVPLDDEFAMVLERRISQNDAISGRETETNSSSTGSRDHVRGKRPSAGSRQSTHRTFSSRSSQSGRKSRSRPGSEHHTPTSEDGPALDESIPSIRELKDEDSANGDEQPVGMEQTSSALHTTIVNELSSKEATPQSSTPALEDLNHLSTLSPHSEDGQGRPPEPSDTPGEESKA